MKIHSFAARFPMMDEWELAEIAADIKKNGQQMPIVVEVPSRVVWKFGVTQPPAG